MIFYYDLFIILQNYILYFFELLKGAQNTKKHYLQIITY